MIQDVIAHRTSTGSGSAVEGPQSKGGGVSSAASIFDVCCGYA